MESDALDETQNHREVSRGRRYKTALLNVIDGVVSQEGRLLIISTEEGLNRLEKGESAYYRGLGDFLASSVNRSPIILTPPP